MTLLAGLRRLLLLGAGTGLGLLILLALLTLPLLAGLVLLRRLSAWLTSLGLLLGAALLVGGSFVARDLVIQLPRQFIQLTLGPAQRLGVVAQDAFRGALHALLDLADVLSRHLLNRLGLL